MRFSFQIEMGFREGNKRDMEKLGFRMGQSRRTSPELTFSRVFGLVFFLLSNSNRCRQLLSTFHYEPLALPFSSVVLTFSNLTVKLNSPSESAPSHLGVYPMHILIAEDDAPVATFLSGGLEAEHFDVQIASTVGQVLQTIEQWGCNLLILDSSLPG